MPPRAIWSGNISFGLVNAPVKMFSAVKERDLHFTMVHKSDGGRIGYQKVCKAEDKPVPNEEIARAYVISDEEMVIVEDEDLAAAEGDDLRQLRILDFVPREQIDPIYIEKTYYLGPGDGGDRVYALLATALSASGLAGVVRYVTHSKEHLGVLRVREDGVITLERMYFADEVRASEGIVPEKAMGEVDPAELEMATKLIGSYSGDFDIARYEDRYRERLMAIIEAKRSGETLAPAAEAPQEAGPDLLAALRASLEATQGGGRRDESAAA